MKVLIVGLGSIAKKHIHALKKNNPQVKLYALRSGTKSGIVEDITNIFSISEIPTDIDFAIISNPTSEHLNTIKNLIFLKVPLFIEKPPLASLQGSSELLKLLNDSKITTYSAFNLRFHPVLEWVKQNLNGKRILEAQAYCGSYLPNWRPESDYRTVYSSKKEFGGGVHLDLIHELDYIIWLFGKPKNVNGFSSKVSDLELDVPDVAHYWLQYETMNASIIVNYYRPDSKRVLEIVFDDDTWQIDLIKFKVSNSAGNILFESTPDMLSIYEAQMSYFVSCLENETKPMNSLAESIETLKLCLTLKTS